jgi:uncharacterized protein (DUF488 family)
MLAFLIFHLALPTHRTLPSPESLPVTVSCKIQEMLTVWTVGHSTRTAEAFFTLLRAHEIELLADIRTVPKSRRNPQFNSDTLAGALALAGMAYVHLPGLGGLRHPRKDSPNSAWQNDSFRGYADHMQTTEFEHSLLDLINRAGKHPTAMMCAEAVPWRCHRSLVADALVARGASVLHIMTESAAKPHKVTSFARIEGTSVTYPGLLSFSE